MRKQHTSPIPMEITCGVKPMPADPESVVSPAERKNIFLVLVKLLKIGGHLVNIFTFKHAREDCTVPKRDKYLDN